MSAREMFEKLDYVYSKNNSMLTYSKDDGGYISQISFIEVGHRIRFKEWEEYNNNETQGVFQIYMDELKAIQQQIKELGWEE